MTDRDGSSDGFLGRWSRKKIEAEREAAPAEPVSKDLTPGEPESSEPRVSDGTRFPAPAAPNPEFDLSSLPSLDSITAVTDVRTFLSPGVPRELARAALRRAWSADPAIRDFKGLAENDWDFTDPTAMPGFGDLPPGYDVKKLVAQIFGDGEKPAQAEPAADKPSDPQATKIAEEISPLSLPATVARAAEDKNEPAPAVAEVGEQQIAEGNFLQCDNNIASHHSSSDDESDAPKNRRQHGGALPK